MTTTTTSKTSQGILESILHIETGTLPLERVAMNLRAQAESVAKLEHDLISLRAAASSVAQGLNNLHESSRTMLEKLNDKQRRPVDGGNHS